MCWLGERERPDFITHHTFIDFLIQFSHLGIMIVIIFLSRRGDWFYGIEKNTSKLNRQQQLLCVWMRRGDAGEWEEVTL